MRVLYALLPLALGASSHAIGAIYTGHNFDGASVELNEICNTIGKPHVDECIKIKDPNFGIVKSINIVNNTKCALFSLDNCDKSVETLNTRNRGMLITGPIKAVDLPNYLAGPARSFRCGPEAEAQKVTWWGFVPPRHNGAEASNEPRALDIAESEDTNSCAIGYMLTSCGPHSSKKCCVKAYPKPRDVDVEATNDPDATPHWHPHVARSCKKGFAWRACSDSPAGAKQCCVRVD